MRSAAYRRIVHRIRVRKEFIEHELESRNFENWRVVTEIMCATWFIRGQLEKMHENLDNEYYESDSDLTRREYKALDKHIDKLENYYWNILYDKGNNINDELLERRFEL